MTQSEFVGVDACPCGWFSVGFNGNGDYELKAFFLFGDLLDYYQAAKLILVDMPIGLPDGPEERLCDPQARQWLRPHTPRVFRAPTRAALEHLVEHPDDKHGVRDVQITITGKSLSEQSLAIMPKIAEVDNLLPREATPQVREVHPEICFWALNDRNHVAPSKHTEAGIEERIRVIKRVESRTEKIFKDGWSEFRKNRVGKDDILDALSAAVTAYGGRNGGLQTLPEIPATDRRGLRMEMVYWQPPPAPELPDSGGGPE